MTIVTALKKLAKTLTGQDVTGTTTDEVLDAFATAATGASVTVDDTITNGGTNPVTGGAIYTALSGKQATLTFDNAPTNESTNPVKSGGVYTALAGKQATLTFDDTPTDASTNPVKSGGVYSAIAAVLPAYSVTEAGKVLKVGETGALEWATIE